MASGGYGYNGNPRLKRPGTQIQFTPEQVSELLKCADDPVYFAKNYIKIVNVDKGLMNFEMWPFQENMLRTFNDNRFVICKMPRQVGKCFDINTIVRIRDDNTGRIFDTTIGDFYELVRKETYQPLLIVQENQIAFEKNNPAKLSDNTVRKFIETYAPTNYSVFSDTGFERIEHLHKTVPYAKWKLVLSTGEELFCADNHIVFDHSLNEIYVKDCIPGKTRLKTVNGISRVKECVNLGFEENMFDMSIDSQNHRFYTNGILSHNSTTIIAYLIHQLIFRIGEDDADRTNIAILANKGATARELMSRLQLAYENLPGWMQQGVVTWNKGNIELENGSKAMAASTSADSVRGNSFNVIFLDEFAFVPNNQADQFFNSVYPTISSGKSSKVLIVSTPNGLNKFYRMWKDAAEKRSTYIPLEVHWSEVPGRDEKWKEETIRNTSEEQFRQEFGTEFIGSSNTLISPAKLRSMPFSNPIESNGNFDIYEKPKDGATYAIMVDVARGQGLDYSAFSVIDVSQIPYRQVAKYRDNNISPLLYPTHVFNAGRLYNDAFILVEISDIGQQIADILHYELEYENLVKIQAKLKQGQQITSGFSKKISFGLKTSVATKRIGCSNLKTLIESDKLLVVDPDTIMELTTFVAQRESFAAEEGNHDDLAMTLVLFGWFVAQRNFKDAMGDDIRKVLQQEQLNMVDEDLLPFGALDNGIFIEDDKDRLFDQWLANREKTYPLDSFAYDWKERF